MGTVLSILITIIVFGAIIKAGCWHRESSQKAKPLRPFSAIPKHIIQKYLLK